MSIGPPEFQGAVCRGSQVLGTACGHCERCKWEQHHRPQPPRRDRDIPTDERLADKEAIKTILRKYSAKFGSVLVGAAMNDLDLER